MYHKARQAVFTPTCYGIRCEVHTRSWATYVRMMRTKITPVLTEAKKPSKGHPGLWQQPCVNNPQRHVLCPLQTRLAARANVTHPPRGEPGFQSEHTSKPRPIAFASKVSEMNFEGLTFKVHLRGSIKSHKSRARAAHGPHVAAQCCTGTTAGLNPRSVKLIAVCS